MNAGSIILAIGVIVFAYLAGSVNFAIVMSKLFTGQDVRSQGSGNAGTTNVLRTIGWVPGLLTFVLDAFKGFIACFAGKGVFAYLFGITGAELFTPIYGAYICCIAVMLGHIFPVFFGFKGGKAVATSVGTFAVCCPLAIILGLVGFALSLIVSRIVSLSSLIATVIVVGVSAVYAVLNQGATYNAVPVVVMAIIAGIIVFAKHSENIKRLLNGNEKRILVKKS